MMKQKKSLTKEQYLRRFSRSARWRLGAAEAEEAIADYQELIFQEERDESKLVEELGDPIQAAWLLTDARGYKRWMWAFTILIGCALSLAWWAHTGLPFYWRLRHGLYGRERQFYRPSPLWQRAWCWRCSGPAAEGAGPGLCPGGS